MFAITTPRKMGIKPKSPNKPKIMPNPNDPMNVSPQVRLKISALLFIEDRTPFSSYIKTGIIKNVTYVQANPTTPAKIFPINPCFCLAAFRITPTVAEMTAHWNILPMCCVAI